MLVNILISELKNKHIVIINRVTLYNLTYVPNIYGYTRHAR